MPIVASFGGLSAFGFGAFPSGDFEPIATVTVGSGGASSITFSGIPSGFQHLQLRAISRSTTSGTSSTGLVIRFNSDSGSNYAHHRLYGTGAAAVSVGSASQTGGVFGNHPQSGATANVFSAIVCDILDYTSTAKNKTVRSFNGYDLNGSGLVLVDSSLWMSTAAITSITIFDGSSGLPNTAQHSTFALYGIKAP